MELENINECRKKNGLNFLNLIGENIMPEISRFQGMAIKMLFLDNDKHHKPHVHVYYGDYEASVGIDGELKIEEDVLCI